MKGETHMTTSATHAAPGNSAISVYICVKNAARAIEFYKEAFDAVETMRLAEPDGRVGHAEITIDGSLVMLSDEYPEMNVRSPESIGGSPVTLHLRVPDVDATVAKAEKAGAKILRQPKDEFYGDRAARLQDPFGHTWHVATQKEALTSEEVSRRYEDLVKQESGT